MQQSNKSTTTITDLARKHLFDGLKSLQEHAACQDLSVKELEQHLQLKNYVIVDLQLQLQNMLSTINTHESASSTDPEDILCPDSLHQTNECLLSHVAEDLPHENEVVQSLEDVATLLETANASALDNIKCTHQTSIHIRKENIPLRNTTSTLRAKNNLLRKEKENVRKTNDALSADHLTL